MGRALLFAGLCVAASAAAQQRFVEPPTLPTPVPPGRSFYFTRAAYTDVRGRRIGMWTTDWPKADIQFLIGLTRLTNIDAHPGEHAIRLDDPNLGRYPLVYAVEVGWMDLTPPEIAGLRRYLLAGGLLFVDDFWGTLEWRNFEHQMRQVLPEYRIVDLPPDHPVRRNFYVVDSLVQVPNIYNGRRGGPTWERDGFTPHLRGILDDHGRLMVLISFNSDLGDAWEWAEDPYYPLPFSNFAYRLGVNAVLYATTH